MCQRRARQIAAAATGLVVALLVLWSSVSSLGAQAQTTPAAQGAGNPNVRLLPSNAAVMLVFVKPERTADFEMVMGKLKEALARSDRPERKQQAAGWKMFKSSDPP